ncbi:MAG: hypothetical protein Ta2A_03210 [Treponemataceae bacterium]|nr:MAG: hypothetical protein Ta2A_03210 [Treponemataceae bacterium]
MKKSIAIVFVLALALCGMAGAFAQSESDFTVSTENGKVTITKYTGKGGAVVIPAKIGGNPVTSIGWFVFSGCTGLTSVSIPAGVTSIGMSAFENCTSLTSVTIPARVTDIGSSAFRGCTGLTTISIPASVTSIGDGAFGSCTGLTSIRIGANVEIRWSRVNEVYSNDAFEHGFPDYYNTNGKKAGVYTYRNGAWSYAAQ